MDLHTSTFNDSPLEQRLQQFASIVLWALEDTDDWDADLMAAIADSAINLQLAHAPNGRFAVLERVTYFSTEL